MNRGEIWWVEVDPSIGSELKKTKPAVIISNDSANRNLQRVVVIPLTSNTAKQYPGEAIISINGVKSKVMADQIMAADKARLKKKCGEILRTDLSLIEDAILLHLGLPR
jgi:mRNA interferase MazF